MLIQYSGALNATCSSFCIWSIEGETRFSGPGVTTAAGGSFGIRNANVLGRTVVASGSSGAIEKRLMLDGYETPHSVTAGTDQTGDGAANYEPTLLSTYKYIHIGRVTTHTWNSAADWENVENGGTIRLDEGVTGVINVPARITELTIAGQSADTVYENTYISMADGDGDLRLTIENLNLSSSFLDRLSERDIAIISLGGQNSTLAIKGKCQVHYTSDSLKYPTICFRRGGTAKTLFIEEDAVLRLEGPKAYYAIDIGGYLNV